MVVEDIALAIGAYDSVYRADIVASYVFEMTKISFLRAQHRGIYQDDGLVIFKGKWTRMQVACLLS
eukprot:12377048-Ditylum_brightwellii.AAC.1